ncbi:hypothetical protein IID20_01250 [Patescibacteria group bacterium]|nr:hypothetical protein [Patescibacteria group bacterium]
MEIRKDSFVWKVAYGVAGLPPRNPNLCRFFWRFVWMFFIGIPVTYFLGGLVMGLMFLISLPFAARPGIFSGDIGNSFVSYRKWPEIKGYRIRPIYFLLPFVLYYFRSVFFWLADVAVFIFSLMVTNIGLSIIGACVVAFLLFYSFKLLRKTEAYQLTKSYLGAKKQGICPLITFIDIPKKTATE